MVGIHRHLVLLDEAADGGDFRHAFDRGQLVAQIPVLHGAQFGQVAVGGIERIHEGPADAGGVRAEAGRDALRQLPAQAAEIFEHAAARPIGIGAVLKNHIDEGEAVERIAAHDLGLRHREHLGRDGIGDLVLDDLRRLAGPLGVDDDLHVRQVGDGVQRNVAHGVNAAQHQRDRAQQDDELVLERKIYDAFEHDSAFGLNDSAQARSWLLLECIVGGASITGISVMPHLGHLPGLSERTSLCSGIGQV